MDQNPYTTLAGLDDDLNGTTVVNNESLNQGSRRVMMAFMSSNDVPQAIKDAITAREAKFADFSIFSIRAIKGTVTQIFKQDDTKEEGLRNIDRARLPEGTILAATYVQLLFAVTYGDGSQRADDPELAKAADWYACDKKFDLQALIGRTTSTTGPVAVVPEGEATVLYGTIAAVTLKDGDTPFAGLETAVITARCDRKDLINEFPLTNFKTNPHSADGKVNLNNPRIFRDNRVIELELKGGVELESDGEEMQIWVMGVVGGTATIPA
ncbi:MAG: hypothetical protein V4543_00730 [Bacteroidota bacterium]